jgi:hypothetical protein
VIAVVTGHQLRLRFFAWPEVNRDARQILLHPSRRIN